METSRLVTLASILAVVDAAVAVYLIGWALRSRRRERVRVLVVGLALVACALFLAVIDRPHKLEQQPPLWTGPGTAL